MNACLRAGLLGLIALAMVSAQPHKIVFLGSTEGLQGAIQVGAEEARLQADFLNIQLQFEQDRDPAHAGNYADAHAVIVNGTPDEVLEAARALSDPGVPVLNVGTGDNELRTECRANLFHIAPSDKMLADAVAQWRKTHPDAKDVRAQAWHPEFVKFAARELNNRYRKATGMEMSDAAWAVWAAYRLVTTAIVNEPEATPKRLVEYFRDELEFDSQKGVFSTFRETGEMRQALLIVAEGKLAGEAPVRGAAASDDLDSLGVQECKP
ncbi:MAG: hypothetical protein GC160_13230 [Acidobacteria bacterium]|nr:hypothetical protein [Acidobacteriota bacterium]